MEKIDIGRPKIVKKLSKKDRFISRTKRRILKHTWIVRAFLIFLFLLVFYVAFLAIGSFFGSLGISDYTSIVSSFVFTPKDNIETFEGNTNLVILGKSGGDNDSPDLTDTIIFVSIDHNEKLINLISIPRDIWVDELRAKINSTYYWGEQKQEGGGLLLAKSIVEKVVGKPVHYAVVLDFDGFVKIVDELSGIEVDVASSFTDEHYPISGKENDECSGDLEFNCRYETVEFNSGLQLMNGETALKFVRSRNADGDDGTDLARAQRQQLIIKGLKNKVLSSEIILSSRALSSLFDVAAGYIESDINPQAASILARRVVQARNNLNSYVIPEDLLINPPPYLYGNLYVFVPVGDNWEAVHDWVSNTLSP